MKKLETTLCEVCGKDTGIVPEMCCNMFDCGCMGQPVNGPLVCSNKRYNEFIKQHENKGHISELSLEPFIK